MSLRAYLSLAFLGFILALGVSFFQSTPGYMDASYYMAGGGWLAGGDGFNEQILWNYLDDPVGLPHPSHGYWMPLTSLMAALGMFVSGSHTFETARLGFLLAAAIVPALTARLSFALTDRKDFALLAGILAAISGFYLSYLPTTDAFGLYMIFAGLFLLVLSGLRPVATIDQDITTETGWRGGSRFSPYAPFCLGLLAGLMHLTRADGIIWLPVAILFAYGDPLFWRRGGRNTVTWAMSALLALAGYLLVMGPWLLRNLSAFGSPLSPGGGRAFWITLYDELFTYPASQLTPAHWWGAGLGAILSARLSAAWLNLQTLIAVQGQVFLLPLILIGLWRLRKTLPVRAGVLAWALTFLVMTLVFPFQGSRGGFFHSGVALQPLFWAVVPVGFDVFLKWGVHNRGWDERRAGRFFGAGLVGMALLLTAFVAYNRVIGGDIRQPTWDEPQRRYVQAEQALQGFDVPSDAIVMVNDAPTFYLASRRPAISIPYGDIDTMFSVAQRYQARFLLLEIEQVQNENLYQQPGDRPGLRYLGTVEGIRMYEFNLR
jgi:hypothetical protein